MQILEENRRPTTAERFAKGLGRLSQSLAQSFVEQGQNEEMQRALIEAGLPASSANLPIEAQKELYKQRLKQPSELEQSRKQLYDEQKNLASARTRKVEEEIKQGPKQPKKTQASQPIDPEQLAIIKKIRNQPEYQDADPLEKYQIMTDAGVSKENAKAEADIDVSMQEIKEKRAESAYKRHEDFIEDTTKRHMGFETEMKPRLLQMQRLVSDDELISPTAHMFLDALGIPLGALDNPSSELYNKLSQDLLKGLPDTYGNRILKVEVDNFLKTIPTLSNSPAGRRMIASNMLKLGEMKEVYYKAMRTQQKQYLDENKPLPKDFQQRVFDQVSPQINKLNDEFVKMSDIKAVPPGKVPMFAPNGNIYFIKKDEVEKYLEMGGKRIW